MIAWIVIASLLLIVSGFLAIQYNFFSAPGRGLRILMYHKVLNGAPDGLTVTPGQFEAHLKYMSEKGFRAVSFQRVKELHDAGRPLPPKTVILTFDDAFLNFRTYALPLLIKYGFSATLFVPVGHMGKTNVWDQGSEPVMSAGELLQLAIQYQVEIGIHSFLHGNYREMPLSGIEEDLNNCFDTLTASSIPFTRVLAYPYGGYPKKDPERKTQMFELFKRLNLGFALRIGNRINPWPLKQPYEVKRIDIKGTDSFFIFKTKLLKGYARRFA